MNGISLFLSFRQTNQERELSMATHKVVHENIRGQFRIQSRFYEITGFLYIAEPSVDGDKMLRRTAGENGGAIGEEDEQYILKYRGQLPRELRGYKLITGRRHPGNRRYISEIYFSGGQWRQYWRELDDEFDYHDIVVRRLS